MNKQLLLFGMFIVFSILIVGCTKNVYYTTAEDKQGSQPVVSELPLLSSSEEIAIIESWSGLNSFHRGTEEFMTLLKEEWKLNVLKLYKGELIFRGQGYNYLFVPELAAKSDLNEDFSSKTREKLSGMSDDEELEWLAENVRKSGGSWVCIAPGYCPGDGQAAAFDSVADIEEFLDWWSTL